VSQIRVTGVSTTAIAVKLIMISVPFMSVPLSDRAARRCVASGASVMSYVSKSAVDEFSEGPFLPSVLG
jgi:hypothetical protein